MNPFFNTNPNSEIFFNFQGNKNINTTQANSDNKDLSSPLNNEKLFSSDDDDFSLRSNNDSFFGDEINYKSLNVIILNESENKENKEENEKNNEETNFIENKKGRKSKFDERSDIKHSILDKDNAIYKSKVQTMKNMDSIFFENEIKKNSLNDINPNESENKENKEENEKKNEETNFIKKKKGRKGKLDDRSDIKHSSSAKDNVIYKLKVHTMKNIYSNIPDLYEKHTGKKIKLNRIEGKILKDGKKKTNEDFFNKTIKDILILPKSKRHNDNDKKKRENIEILNDIKIDEIKELLNMKFEDYIKTIFMLTHKEFYERFKVKNSYLFSEILLNKEQRSTMSELIINKGILNYYKDIKGRERKKNNS